MIRIELQNEHGASGVPAVVRIYDDIDGLVAVVKAVVIQQEGADGRMYSAVELSHVEE